MKKYLIIFLSLIVGFCTGTIGKIGYEKASDKPYYWKSPPIILNCYGEEFSELNLIRAIDYWAVRGHSIGFYEINPPKEVCDGDIPFQGFIILRKAKGAQLPADTLATTKRRTSLARMLSAEIVFEPGSYRLDYLIEHELGHAFGYNHIEIDNHIMHPLYPHIGPDFYLP